jgi:hypothetical protein
MESVEVQSLSQSIRLCSTGASPVAMRRVAVDDADRRHDDAAAFVVACVGDRHGLF